jgi:hypothetical protein
VRWAGVDDCAQTGLADDLHGHVDAHLLAVVVCLDARDGDDVGVVAQAAVFGAQAAKAGELEPGQRAFIWF